MAGPFTKVFRSILQSSVWCEDKDTKLTWVTMILLADLDGNVYGSVPGLARFVGIETDECRAALTKLSAPDTDSRTPDHEGRRILPIDGGWHVVNALKYRLMQPDGTFGNPHASTATVGKVYFVRAGNAIKVGFSQNPWARLNALKTGMPVEPELIGYFAGKLEDERAVHERFKESRLNREWFRATPELLAFVARVATGSKATTKSDAELLPAANSELQQKREGEGEEDEEVERTDQRIAAAGAAEVPERATTASDTIETPGTPPPQSAVDRPATSRPERERIAVRTAHQSAWTTRACELWIKRYGGTAPGGRIGKALKPLVTRDGDAVVLAAFELFLAETGDHEKAFRTPGAFANTFYGEYRRKATRAAQLAIVAGLSGEKVPPPPMTPDQRRRIEKVFGDFDAATRLPAAGEAHRKEPA